MNDYLAFGLWLMGIGLVLLAARVWWQDTRLSPAARYLARIGRI